MTLTRLQEEGKTQTHTRTIAKRYSYYQLTAKGCAEVGVSKDRARPLTSETLSKNLGVLWFATMKGARRARLADDRLPSGCPPPPGKAPHVFEEIAVRQGCIYRIQIAAEGSSHEYPFGQIEQAARLFAATPGGSDFLRTGAYAFAVLVNEEEKKARFEEELPRLLPKLPDGVRVIVETVPSTTNLQFFL